MNFVDFNLSKKLKEKGFTCQYPMAMYNELGDFHALYTSADHNPDIKSVFGNREYYDYDDFDDKDCVCPTISQILKWFREEKKIYVSIEVEHENWFEYKIVQTIKGTHCNSTRVYETYDDAMLAGIEYVLDNLI